jgi:hypothetical protein
MGLITFFNELRGPQSANCMNILGLDNILLNSFSTYIVLLNIFSIYSNMAKHHEHISGTTFYKNNRDFYVIKTGNSLKTTTEILFSRDRHKEPQSKEKDPTFIINDGGQN